ncbi:MAG: PAS domain-containing protein [Candidatus Hydrogenedentes bacterium]|nr:PAS domain-containing protein [Candidatus Hydrogenedentota bacterium]
MARKRLIWQLFPLFILVSLGSLATAGLYATQTLKQSYLSRSIADLEARARLLEAVLSDSIQRDEFVKLQERCTELGRVSSTRITVIAPSGEVVADSEADPKTLENHGSRPEVRTALAGGVGTSDRASSTTHAPTIYVAIPVKDEEGIRGVIRVAVPKFTYLGVLVSNAFPLGVGTLLVLSLVALLSLAASRRITDPIDSLRKGAERFARGELVARLRAADSAEVTQLAEAMNTMAAQLEERIRAAEGQRNELEAVFASMVEGVLAVDTHERVININAAACAMFDISRDKALGRDLREVIRNADLHEFVAVTLRSSGSREADITLLHPGEQQVRLHGSPLKDAVRRNIGCVIVLHDVTAINRLESARRDFVANVSHELKTPITSIKGFVETLLDGALDDHDSARRFLATIGKQASRLDALIEDLLKLSRVEQEGERGAIELHDGQIQDILESAVQNCGVRALAKDVRILLNAEPNLFVRRNPELLQTAIENLLDNAVKYSEEGTEVDVSAVRDNGTVTISVRDQGCGIERQHLPRIFERFYRVDKARSRKLGGTGLGLAIVKHIVRVHGGQTSVDSAPQKGSVFSIHLPEIHLEQQTRNVV